MAASVRAHNRVSRKRRVERAPIIRVWAWPGKAATGSGGVCPAHYVAFSCPRGGLDRMVGLQLVFKRPTARESPKAMEPPAVSRFLYQANHRRRKNEYQGKFLQPKSVLSQCMAKSNNFRSLQPLGSLFSTPSLCFQ